MKLILAILFAFVALSMGFKARNQNSMFMQTNAKDECPAEVEFSCNYAPLCESQNQNNYCCGCPDSLCFEVNDCSN